MHLDLHLKQQFFRILSCHCEILLRMKVDFVLSCGCACRPAYHTKKYFLRKFSSPCDWMMNYSLVHFIDVLKNEGKNMFRIPRLDEENKWVVDEENGMISMHDFKTNVPLDIQLPDFYAKMERRAKNTINKIKQSRCVGIVMNRHIGKSELLEFAHSLEMLFPECVFYIINIKDIPDYENSETTYVIKTDKYIVKEICFDDSHYAGRDKSKNSSFWIGNEALWGRVLVDNFYVKGCRYKYYKQRIIQKIRGLYNRILKLFDSE